MKGITTAAMIGMMAFALPTPVPGRLGEIFVGAVDADTKDVVIAYTTEPGATCAIYVVDSGNNGADPQMKVEKLSKAVVFWVLKEDTKTTNPQSSCTFTENEMDPRSLYRFVGVTPEKSARQQQRSKPRYAEAFHDVVACVRTQCDLAITQHPCLHVLRREWPLRALPCYAFWKLEQSGCP